MLLDVFPEGVQPPLLDAGELALARAQGLPPHRHLLGGDELVLDRGALVGRLQVGPEVATLQSADGWRFVTSQSAIRDSRSRSKRPYGFTWAWAKGLSPCRSRSVSRDAQAGSARTRCIIRVLR